MRDEKVTPEPGRRLFQEPTGYGQTPTEQLPALGGRTETLAAEPLPAPVPPEHQDTRGDQPVTDDPTLGDRPDTVDDHTTDPATVDDHTDSSVNDRTGERVDDRTGDRTDDRVDGHDGAIPSAVPTSRHTGASEHGTAEDPGAVLFGDDVVTGFRGRWRELQADFVDDPKRAVEGADQLVDEVMHKLTETLTAHKKTLSGQWQGNDGDTEELRLALRKYRSFLDQLLRT